jgi:hypothetical protein
MPCPFKTNYTSTMKLILLSHIPVASSNISSTKKKEVELVEKRAGSTHCSVKALSSPTHKCQLSVH